MRISTELVLFIAGKVRGRVITIDRNIAMFDGAKIGDGCVIAAGAVVKGGFPENSVIGGVPARVISKRNKESE